MNPSRRLAAIAAALAVLAAVGPSRAMPPTFVPPTPETVLERLPAGSERPKRAGNRDSAMRVAERELRLGRISGDPRHDGRAEAALAAWDGVKPVPTRILLLRALLAQRRHDFNAALSDLDLLLERDPDNDQGWLMRAGILQVRGDYAASKAACRRLGSSVGQLVTTVCNVAASDFANRAHSIQLLERSIDAAPNESADVRAWALGVLAERRELAADFDGAESALRKGLEIAPDDPFLRVALADFLIQQGRVVASLTVLPADGASLELTLRRARSLVLLGRGAPERRALAATFALTRLRGERPHLRSEAYYRLYVAHDANAALPLAIENFAEQREPIDRRILLDAASAANRPEAADPLRRWLASNGAP